MSSRYSRLNPVTVHFRLDLGDPRPCRCSATFSDSIPKLLAPVWGALGSLATDPAGPEVALERRLTAAQEAVAAVEAAGKQLDPDASLFFTVADLHATACMCLGPAHWCALRCPCVVWVCFQCLLVAFHEYFDSKGA